MLNDTKSILPSNLQIYDCPLEDSYHFISFCAVKTCKYFTLETSNRCMLLVGRSGGMFSDTGKITDFDLLRWKSRLLNIESVKELKLLRRDAIKKVNALIVLDRYLRYIEDNMPFCRIKRPCSQIIATDLLKDVFPFTLKELAFKDWMSIYMFSEETYYEFYKAIHIRSECNIALDLSSTKLGNKKPRKRKKSATTNIENTTTEENAQTKTDTNLIQAADPLNKPVRTRSVSKPKTLDLRLADLCFMKKRPWEEMRSSVISCGSSLKMT